jgi:hypothetical protein
MTVIEAAPPSPRTRANDPPAPSAREPHHPPALLRRGQLVALAVGTFLLPWCVLLGLTLPAADDAQHWSLAWAGLDCAEAVAALATAVLLRRADPRAGLAAVACGTLLLVDAWFDVCTSAPGLDHAMAVAEACCLELPLAAAAFWLALSATGGADVNRATKECEGAGPYPDHRWLSDSTRTGLRTAGNPAPHDRGDFRAVYGKSLPDHGRRAREGRAGTPGEHARAGQARETGAREPSGHARRARGSAQAREVRSGGSRRYGAG